MANCRWVKSPATPGVNAVFCEKPVHFKMVPDDDDRPVRKYNAFCDEHMQKAEQQEQESPDDWAF